MLGQIDKVRESRMYYMVRRQRSGILVPQREAIRTVVLVRRVQLQTLLALTCSPPAACRLALLFHINYSI